MNVLLTVHCFYPKHIFGTETYTLEIARTLLKLGHNVTVLTTNSHTEPSNGRPYVEYTYDSVPVISIDTTNHPVENFKETYLKKENNNVIRSIIERVNPNIIHCLHTLNLSVSFLKEVEKLNIPSLITLTDFFGICFNCKLQRHDGSFCLGPNSTSSNCLECYFSQSPALNSLREKSGMFGKLSTSSIAYATKLPGVNQLPLIGEASYITNRLEIIKDHYQCFKKMIAPTNFLGESYGRNGYPKEKIKKLTFGINRSPLDGYTKPRKGFTRNIRFGYIGQLYWHKGVDVLIKAFNKLEGTGTSLKIYGDTNQDTNYTNKLLELIGDKDNIQLLGTFPKEQQGEILRDIDVLVVPSLWYENAPLVLLNGLATRIPVISSNVDGMNEFVKHGYNGFLFEPGNVDDLYQQLRKCIEEPQQLEVLSENSNYTKSIQDNVEEILEIYQEVL